MEIGEALDPLRDREAPQSGSCRVRERERCTRDRRILTAQDVQFSLPELEAIRDRIALGQPPCAMERAAQSGSPQSRLRYTQRSRIPD
jgi:hypothetical protein